MAGYTLGVILVVIVFALVFLGFAHRVLDRLYLNDRAALLFLLAMVIGSFINIPLTSGRIVSSINIGGALLPLGLAIYVLSRAGTRREVGRALLVAIATTAVLYSIGLFTRGVGEPWEVGGLGLLDPLFYYPIIAGIIAYLVGRSRRAAFVGAILGVLLLDVVDLIYYLSTGLRGTVAFGGGGVIDVTFMAAVIAVLLAEVIGEGRERLQGGPKEAGRHHSLLAGLRRPLAKPVPNKTDNKRGGPEHE